MKKFITKNYLLTLLLVISSFIIEAQITVCKDGSGNLTASGGIATIQLVHGNNIYRLQFMPFSIYMCTTSARSLPGNF